MSKLTTKQQLDTHDELIAKLAHVVFEGSEVALEQSTRIDDLFTFIVRIHETLTQLDEETTDIEQQINKFKDKVKRLQWVVIAQGLSLLAIVYLLWLKL